MPGESAPSEENAYPPEELVTQAFARVGMPVQHIPRDDRAAQAATAVQLTGKKLGPLVPEFKRVITVTRACQFPGSKVTSLIPHASCRSQPKVQACQQYQPLPGFFDVFRQGVSPRLRTRTAELRDSISEILAAGFLLGKMANACAADCSLRATRLRDAKPGMRSSSSPHSSEAEVVGYMTP